jgi:hypothetical protein
MPQKILERENVTQPHFLGQRRRNGQPPNAHELAASLLSAHLKRRRKDPDFNLLGHEVPLPTETSQVCSWAHASPPTAATDRLNPALRVRQ